MQCTPSWESCQGLSEPTTIARQLLSGSSDSSGHGATAGVVDAAHCTCLSAHYEGSEIEHTMMLACLWVAFALSVLILLYYIYCTYKERCGWEEVYVVMIEMLKTIMEVFFEASIPATILQFNGVKFSWLRYAEWLLTCPVILIHLSNLTGLGHYNKRTMRLLVSDIGTIICGVTAAMCTGPAKIVFFLLGLCYGSSTFLTAASVYISAFREVPAGECKLLVKLCAWVFFGSWLLFPLLFLMGPEGFGHLSPYGSIIAHTFADLLSKNLWGLLAHHLRNKIQDHIKTHGSIDAVAAEVTDADAAPAVAINKLSPPLTPKGAAMVAARAAADAGAVAMISLGSPTKASATLGRHSFSQTGAWDAAGTTTATAEPVRVLLGLPAEGADSVLQQFHEQFAALPFAAEALPATGAQALLSAAANAAAFGGADAVLLHISYLRPGAPGVASGSGLVGTIKEMGIRVCVYGCDVGGPTEDDLPGDVAACLDGWVEGPTWAAPLNNRQLAALLLMMSAARGGSRPPSGQGFSHPASPRGITVTTGPLLRSRSSGTSPVLVGPLSSSRRPSFEAGAGISSSNNLMSMRSVAASLPPLRTASTAFGAAPPAAPSAASPVTARPAAAPAASPGLSVGVGGTSAAVSARPAPAAAASGASCAAGLNMNETQLLQELMGEISRLKRELSGEVRP